MKTSISTKQFRFYLLLALAYLLVRVLHDLSSTPETFKPRIFNNIWAISYLTVINYILFEFTIPFFSQKKISIILRIIAGIFLLWVHLLFYSFGLYGWRYLGILLHIWTPLIVFPTWMVGVYNQVEYSFAAIIFFGIIRHIYKYIKLRQEAQQLLIEKQAAELNHLRSQTNPHFLFNTLNNIYSLAKDKSDLAPESILRLSKILRFMLYETSGPYIAIQQELKVITDYIALEQLRYDDSLTVQFNYDVEDMNQSIPPLLLIPLVENAFKHGVSETRTEPFIDIHLSIIKRQLKLIVKNSAEHVSEQSTVKENIGLSNLSRQLELLYKDYTLNVQQKEHEFWATLTINLASHV